MQMKLFSGKQTRNSKPSRGSILLYTAGSVVMLIAVASLIMNIILFNQTVSQYVAQGYPSDVVLKQLIPAQLLPGLFEAAGLYGGIAILLFGAGLIHTKIAIVLKSVWPADNCTEVSPADSSSLHLETDHPEGETETTFVDATPNDQANEQNSKDSDS